MSEPNVLVILDSGGNVFCEVEFDDQTWNAILEVAMRDFVMKAVQEQIDRFEEEHPVEQTIKEAPPEIEALLAEEEKKERLMSEYVPTHFHDPKDHSDGYYCSFCEWP
jgi:hypothetical protein